LTTSIKEIGKYPLLSDIFGTLFIIVIKAICALYFPTDYDYNAVRERG
jgi:hypothetical protein